MFVFPIHVNLIRSPGFNQTVYLDVSWRNSNWNTHGRDIFANQNTYFCNIWNVHSAQAAAFIFDWRIDLLDTK